MVKLNVFKLLLSLLYITLTILHTGLLNTWYTQNKSGYFETFENLRMTQDSLG